VPYFDPIISIIRCSREEDTTDKLQNDLSTDKLKSVLIAELEALFFIADGVGKISYSVCLCLFFSTYSNICKAVQQATINFKTGDRVFLKNK
jgi:hypothetical protein